MTVTAFWNIDGFRRVVEVDKQGLLVYINEQVEEELDAVKANVHREFTLYTLKRHLEYVSRRLKLANLSSQA